MKEWLLDETDIEYIALGAALLGTGGGGNAYLGKLRAWEQLRAGRLDARQVEADVKVGELVINGEIRGTVQFVRVPYDIEAAAKKIIGLMRGKYLGVYYFNTDVRVAVRLQFIKGNRLNVSLFPYDPALYPLLVEQVTAERVHAFFRHRGATGVRRYELPLP